MSYAQARQAVLRLLPKRAEGAEIGVWQGDFSARILEVAAPRRLHLIDPWQVRTDPLHDAAWYGSKAGVDLEATYQSVLDRFAPQRQSGQVVIHRAPSEDAMGALPDGSLDFTYVDGDHAYPAVRTDLELAFAKTRPGGLICVDDHQRGKWWGDGVVRAVNELLGAHPQNLQLTFMAHAQVVIVRI